MYWIVLFCLVVIAVPETSGQEYAESYLETEVPEVVIQDLAGRRRLITRDEDSDKLTVHWVMKDPHTKLPYVEDPGTGFPYLLEHSVTKENIKLYRLLRGHDHKPVVADLELMALYRPQLNDYEEVVLKPISQQEAGFSVKEVMGL